MSNGLLKCVIAISGMKKSKLANLLLVFALSLITGSNSYILAAEQSTLFNADGTLNSLGVLKYSDWSVRWKSYPTALPEWTSSVSYVGAWGSRDGLVAPCGESGQVAYMSKRKPTNILRLSRMNLRTGINTEFELPTLDLSVKHKVSSSDSSSNSYIEDDMKWISCSADGSRIALSFERYLGRDFIVQKSFLVELSTLKITTLGEVMIGRRIEVTGRPISPLFTLVLGSKATSDEAMSNGMKTLPVEDVVDVVKKYYGKDSIANVFLKENSAFIIISGNQKENPAEKLQLVTFIQMGGEKLSEVKKCSFKGYHLRYVQPASTGLIITASPVNDFSRTRPYYLKQGDHDGGVCDMEPIEEWALTSEAETRGYAGDPSFLASVNFHWPEKMVDTFDVDFYLSDAGRIAPIFSSHIEFKGRGTIDEQPLVWMPLSAPSKEQFTFVYGPHGAGTAIVHFWKINSAMISRSGN